MNRSQIKTLEEAVCLLQAAAWPFKMSLVPKAERMLRRLQPALKLMFHWHPVCQRRVGRCSLHSAHLRDQSSPRRLCKGPAPHGDATTNTV